MLIYISRAEAAFWQKTEFEEYHNYKAMSENKIQKLNKSS